MRTTLSILSRLACLAVAHPTAAAQTRLFGELHQMLPSSSAYSEAFAFGDVNGDGSPDLVAGGYWEESRLYLGDGTGSFAGAPATNLPAGSDRTLDVLLEDVDGDLHPDLVLGNHGEQNPFDPLRGHAVTAQPPSRDQAVSTSRIGDLVGDLLLRALAGPEEDWEAGIAHACEQHPDQADTLRTRFEQLNALGLARKGSFSSSVPAPDRLGGSRLLELLGSGGLLHGAGSASVGADDLAYHVTGTLPAQPGLLFVGQSAEGAGDGLSFGDGLRCAGVSVVRIETSVPDGAGSMSFGPGLHALGGWGAGDTRYFQVWYRDPSGSPCTSGFNLTNGVEVAFLP